MIKPDFQTRSLSTIFLLWQILLFGLKYVYFGLMDQKAIISVISWKYFTEKRKLNTYAKSTKKIKTRRKKRQNKITGTQFVGHGVMCSPRQL